MAKNARWVYSRAFKGLPTADSPLKHFELVQENMPACKDGEVLFKAAYLSVDPYTRAYANELVNPTGYTMFCSQVAEVVESKHADFKVGTYVVGQFRWQLYTACDPDDCKSIWGDKSRPIILPDFCDLPHSLALGTLGMPGNTAYFGFLEICNPKAGDVVVVSGAAGDIGSLVGQIAKIKGCHAIGIAGSDAKVAWLKNELGFDAGINYKTQNVTDELKKLAPNGVDCYFDNVGGEISSQVLNRMSKYGRISVCRAISSYNYEEGWDKERAPVVQPTMIMNELRMEGFVVTRWQNRWKEGITQMMRWMKEGKLKYKETVTEGFSKMPEAFIGMLKGENTGEAIVKV